MYIHLSCFHNLMVTRFRDRYVLPTPYGSLMGENYSITGYYVSTILAIFDHSYPYAEARKIFQIPPYSYVRFHFVFQHNKIIFYTIHSL